MARNLCPSCISMGRLYELQVNWGSYACPSCGAFFTPGSLTEARRKQAREWENRIASALQVPPGLLFVTEGVTRAALGESASPATDYVVSSLGD